MIIKLCGAVFTAVIFTYCFCRKEQSVSFAVSLAAIVMILVSALESVKPLVNFISGIHLNQAADISEYCLRLSDRAYMRAVSSLASVGEEPLSGAVELFGKVEILVLCLPLLKELLSMCTTALI